MEKKWWHWLEDFILTFLIILNILDFLEYLPGDVDFVKKLISWLCLGYLLYKVSLSDLFFGQRDNFLDIILVCTYFLFIIKNIVAFAMVAVEETNVLQSFYTFLVSNRFFIESLGIYVGGFALVTLALYATIKLKVQAPSVLHIIHEEGSLTNAYKRIERFLVIFLLFISFFVIVFNLMMEWLAIAIDASLLVFTLIFYLVTLFQRHYKFSLTIVISLSWNLLLLPAFVLRFPYTYRVELQNYTLLRIFPC